MRWLKAFGILGLSLVASLAHAQGSGQFGGATGSNGASGTTSGQSANSIPVASSSTALTSTVCTPPSVNGIYVVEYNVTGSAAVAPTCPLVGLTPDAAANATILYSDNNSVIYNPAAALTLPTPTSLGNSNFFSVLINNAATTSIITPTTWTISLNGGTAGATAVIAAHTRCTLAVDQITATQWDLDCMNVQNQFGAATATSIATGTSPPTCTAGTSGAICFNEGTAPTGASSVDDIYADSTTHCVTLINQTANIGCAVGSLRAVMTADWTCGTTGTVASCTTATIVGSTGVPLTITLPLAALSYDWDCDLVVSQATGATANNWNMLTATNGATNVTVSYTQGDSATTFAAGATTDQGATTTTFNIGGTWTLGGTGTKMPVHIHGRIEGASASGTVVSLQLVAPTVGDLVTIYRGASCWAH